MRITNLLSRILSSEQYSFEDLEERVLFMSVNSQVKVIVDVSQEVVEATFKALLPVDQSVNADQVAALRKIAAYPFLQVRNKLLKSGEFAVEQTESMIFEFRRWLALIVLGNNGIPMISTQVDEVWHTFIVYTRDYTNFCNDVFGRYIHHQPIAIPTEWARNFQLLYANTFGGVPTLWAWNDDSDEGEDYCYHHDPSDDDEA
jgi:hypothetical protein